MPSCAPEGHPSFTANGINQDRINLHAGLLSGPTTHETRAPQAQAAFAYKASGYAALRADSI